MGFSSQKPQLQLPAEADRGGDGDLLKSMRKLHNKEPVDEDVVLVKVELFSRPLSSLASGSSSSGEFKKNGLGAVLTHDYFVLTVLSKDGGLQPERYLFEKFAQKQCGVFAGTVVSVRTYHAVENEKSRLKIDLKRAKVAVDALYDALIEDAYEYNMFTLNCWHYGHEMPKEIIRLALEYPEMPEADQAELLKAIKSVEDKERPNVVEILRLINNPPSPKNEKTWNKVENLAEGKPWVRLIKFMREVIKFMCEVHDRAFNRHPCFSREEEAEERLQGSLDNG